MDQDALVNEQIDAAREFIEAFSRQVPQYPVKVAFWLKADEDPRWWLYIASEAIEDVNIDSAYQEVFIVAGTFDNPNFDPFRVKLISAKSALARAAIEVQERRRARIPTRFLGHSFGGISVEQVYIYPPIAATPIGQ